MSQEEARPPNAAARPRQDAGPGDDTGGTGRAAPQPAVVSSLAPGTAGRWLVRSHNTTHMLDLDAHTYERRPGPASQRFLHDGVPVRLTRVEVWPTVGGRMLIWFDDPDTPDLLEHWRLCSTIRGIAADPGAGDTAM